MRDTPAGNARVGRALRFPGPVLVLALVALLLVLAACDVPLLGGPTPGPSPTKLKPPTPTPPPAAPTPAALPSPAATPSPAIPLTDHQERWYAVPYPQGWGVLPGSGPEERRFAPDGQPGYGILVRVEGLGYTFSVLDSLINSEVEALRREGLVPQEQGVRRAETLPNDTVGRSAEFLVQLAGQPVRMQVTALVANFTAAYVLRLWAPQAAFEAQGYAPLYARVVQGFLPRYNPEPTATPTPGPSLSPTEGPPAATAEASATALSVSTLEEAARVPPLSEEPYRGETFAMPYPQGWTPTVNLDATVNFLAPDPDLLVGISVHPLGRSYNPDRDPVTLLDAYLAEVTQLVPGARINDVRVEDDLGGRARGLSTTYVVSYERGRLVYRVTALVSRAPDGAAFRILQWAPEADYEAGYRLLFRAVVAGFEPLPAAASQEESQ